MQGHFACTLHRTNKEITRHVERSQGTRLMLPSICAARRKLHPREPYGRRAVNTLFQAEEPQIGKRIAVVVVGVMLLGGALWVGIAMALHVVSGR